MEKSDNKVVIINDDDGLERRFISKDDLKEFIPGPTFQEYICQKCNHDIRDHKTIKIEELNLDPNTGELKLSGPCTKCKCHSYFPE